MGKLRWVDCPCGKGFHTTNHATRWHSDECRKNIYKELRRGHYIRKFSRTVKYGTVGSHTPKEWTVKCRLFGYLCFWCGKEMLDRNITKDHLQPLSRGGTEDITNIVPACGRCNSRKGSKTAAEFRQFLDKEKLDAMGIFTY